MTPLDRFGRSWAGRHVTVVGLGRSGIAAAQLLARTGARVRVTEAQDTAELQQRRIALLTQGIEAVELGGHSRPFIDGAQVVVVSPGVPDAEGPIPWALEARCPVLSEIELAFALCSSPVVAVTGTNGKSTAVTLITEVLWAAGRRAVACGNIGIPFSSVVSTLTPEAVAVVEVSSFQLLWCDAFRPTVGVLLNIGTNHLDRHQDPSAYVAAKARLFQRQTKGDWAVLNGNDPRVVAIGERVAAQRVWFGDHRTNPERFRLAPQTLRIFSEGAQAVLQTGRLLGIADPLIWQVLRAFRGLEHRLEPVAATPRGVRWVNDSKSTTPESLLFALRQTPGEVVVILGGRDKRLDFSALVEPLHTKRINGIVLMGESRPRLKALLNGTDSSVPVRECETLEEAVRTAESLARPGTTVLFSPACASFDMFQDFEARGRAFKALVGG